jgi:hypothetical protein
LSGCFAKKRNIEHICFVGVEESHLFFCNGRWY